ncbi:MAG: TrmH family RNA methyltransferase [Gammaproteobacteria bacterium]|jgi:TrmH family RNA methyltransferase
MKLDDVKKLHQKKYRAKLGYYLVEGEHLILELQKAELRRLELRGNVKNQARLNDVTVYVTEEYQDWASQLNIQFTIVTINNKQMVQLSDTETPQGIIACVPLPSNNEILGEQAISEQHQRCIYLHEVQDPGNLGTILRSLAWFGNFRLLLSPNSVDPFNSKVVRASMGAIFHVPVELEVELSDLATRFKKFAYLDLHGSCVNTQEFANYDCYLFGNEARGVPLQALSAFDADAFTIPGSGIIDSLNLASAVNICVYQLSV